MMTEANISVLTVENDDSRFTPSFVQVRRDDVACRMRVAGRGQEKRKYSSVMQITNKRLQSAENVDVDGDALGGND